VRPLRQRVGQLGDVFDVKIDQLANACATGVAAGNIDNPGIAVGAVEA